MRSQETIPSMESTKGAKPHPLELARERLIVALDVPDSKSAMRLVAELEGTCKWFKVGLELFVAAGPAVLEPIVARGHNVFLDLKLHDIPNTVAGAVRSAAGLGVRMLTVHAGGGPAMLAAAKGALAGVSNPPELLAVTVLTSMDAAQLESVGVNRAPAGQVEHAGEDGVGGGDSRICLLAAGGCSSACLDGAGRCAGDSRNSTGWSCNRRSEADCWSGGGAAAGCKLPRCGTTDYAGAESG